MTMRIYRVVGRIADGTTRPFEIAAMNAVEARLIVSENGAGVVQMCGHPDSMRAHRRALNQAMTTRRIAKMNNVNGAALLARIRAGDLVTVRLLNGNKVTGRARPFADTAGFVVQTDSGRGVGINAGNIINVRPMVAVKE